MTRSRPSVQVLFYVEASAVPYEIFIVDRRDRLERGAQTATIRYPHYRGSQGASFADWCKNDRGTNTLEGVFANLIPNRSVDRAAIKVAVAEFSKIEDCEWVRAECFGSSQNLMRRLSDARLSQQPIEGTSKSREDVLIFAAMELSYVDALAYVTTPKRLTQPSSWTFKANRENRYPIACFGARLTMDQVMPRGMRFRISLFPHAPNSATFQMELELPKTRTCLTLYRLEWRALSGHMNGMDAHLPPELRGLVFLQGQSHEHSCLDHRSRDRQRILSKGVQCARPVNPDPATYEDALRYVCATLSIVNPETVPASGVQWSLFGGQP